MLVTKQQQTYENYKKATADRPALYTNQLIQSQKNEVDGNAMVAVEIPLDHHKSVR